MPTAARLLVLDFDGTMTDAEIEGAPYRQGVLEDVALLARAELSDVLAWAKEHEAEIASDPQHHGWTFKGRIVAPATVDPYLRVMPVARKILDRVGRFRDEEDRAAVLEGLLYKYNYRKTVIAFREGALEVLNSMADRAVYVVTNSHREAVQDKLRVLGGGRAREGGAGVPGDGEGDGSLGWLVERVHGSARKFEIDEDFTAVPSSMSLPSLPRPVLLRRRAYFEVLDRLRRQVGCSWEDVVVCGDIFELDLALPQAMGARVGLLANPFTPPWERAHLQDHPRGAVLDSVRAIPAFCGF